MLYDPITFYSRKLDVTFCDELEILLHRDLHNSVRGHLEGGETSRPSYRVERREKNIIRHKERVRKMNYERINQITARVAEGFSSHVRNAKR